MEGDLVIQAVRLIAQLSIILIFAKIGAEICERFFKQPAVLGELLVGVILSPFIIGSFIPFLEGTSLFPMPDNNIGIPISAPLFSVAQLGAVILLFIAGLETNLKQFLKYAWAATFVAIGGVVLPFIFGAYLTVVFGLAQTFLDPAALFVGVILTATSVGITARVLSDLNKLDTPEGVTILGAAVVDDVIGILILSIVIAIGVSKSHGNEIDIREIGVLGLTAVGFWLGILVIGILGAPYFEKFLLKFKSRGATISLTLALCFLCSFLAESAGLAMIIGAYAIGLALSTRPIAKELIESLQSVYHVFVPVFFVVTGMMVNLKEASSFPLFILIITIVAILAKWLGCYIPAVLTSFNRTGANRIGIGMIPRGEIALIVAQVGIAKGIISSNVYGVAIIMTFVTTLIAPVLLLLVFKNPKSGVRKKGEQPI